MFSKWSGILSIQVTVPCFHLENIPLSGYIDDFFSQKAENFCKCEENIGKIKLLIDKLGLMINLKISQIISTQKMKISWFQID